jgi:hypothetical protein
LRECDDVITDGKVFDGKAFEMTFCGMIYILSFVKIGTGVEAILRFYLSNLSGSNVDIANGKDL